MPSSAERWATEEFGDAGLGDARRTKRLVSMAARAARKPAGRVTEVFESARERQGAYDFLEESHAQASAIVEASAHATTLRCEAMAEVIVALDGSSLTITDSGGKKGFGTVGTYWQQSRGLKVINALAISLDGVTLGLTDQQWWCRPYDRTRSVRAGAIAKKKRNRKTPTEEKETQRWIDSIHATERRFKASANDVRRVYIIDREADCRALIATLMESQQGFIVRSSWDRNVEIEGKAGQHRLRAELANRPVIGHRDVAIGATSKRRARTARFALQTAEVTLCMRDNHGRGAMLRARMQVVRAREVGTTPAGEKALEWTLLTNLTTDDAHAVATLFDKYTLRWRIEEFHKTLKSDGCNAEQMQLRSPLAAIKWATILSAVAARAERLKHLARTAGEQPASTELTPSELRVLILLKRKEKKRTEQVPSSMPTLAQAVLWLAELGSYNGKSAGGPPGAVTIGRGLLRVRHGAEALDLLEGEPSDQ